MKNIKKISTFVLLLLVSCSLLFCKSDSSDDSTKYKTLDMEDGAEVIDGKLHITQYGITWRFDAVYEYGTYATGDYWVVGPVKITYISPPATKSDSTYRNGSMVNPSPTDLADSRQGWTSDTLEYVESLNAARPGGNDLSDKNPLELQPHSSLCSSIARTEDRRPKIETISILTVVETKPKEGDFRPPYTGTNKNSQYNIADIDYSVLAKNLTPPDNTPDLSDMEESFKRPWIDITQDHLFGEIAPNSNMPTYGREYAILTSEAALMLMLNYTNDQKKTLLTRYIQLGLDLYGSMKSGMVWKSNGGWMHGRKLPILVAAMCLNNTTMLIDISNSVNNTPKTFQEDGQTFYISSSDLSIDHDTWSGASHPSIEYISADASNSIPEWGIKHDHTPSYDNRNWLADYRSLNGMSNAGTAIAVYLLGARSTWNWDAYFDYIDRFMTREASMSDKDFDGQGSLFCRTMWNEYRDNYYGTYPLWTAPSGWSEFPEQ